MRINRLLLLSLIVSFLNPDVKAQKKDDKNDETGNINRSFGSAVSGIFSNDLSWESNLFFSVPIVQQKLGDRVGLNIEIPFLPKMTTTDTYTTLGDFQGETKNKYTIWALKVGVIYYLKSLRMTKGKYGSAFLGANAMPYYQVPIAPTIIVEGVTETRHNNFNMGMSIQAGYRFDFFPERKTGSKIINLIKNNVVVDVKCDYAILFRVESQSFIFNYFGSASGFSTYRNASFVTPSVAINFFIK